MFLLVVWKIGSVNVGCSSCNFWLGKFDLCRIKLVG